MKLTEQEIISLIREEWDRKVTTITEGLKLAAQVKGEKQPLIAPELKIVHKASGIRYTVDSVSMRNAVLRNPEGEKFVVDEKELNSEYEIA